MIDQPDARDVATCTYCPKMCRAVCPVAEVEKRETVTPWGLMNAISLKAQGHSAIKGEGAQVLWHCLECRRCQQHCLDHVDVGASVQAARFQAWAEGDAPAKAKSLANRFKKTGNPFGPDLAAAAQASTAAEDCSKESRVVLMADCSTARHYPNQLPKTLKVLKAAGINATLWDTDITCCGAPLYHAGDLEAFTAHAKKVQRALRDKNQVVIPSPGCAHIMNDIYSEVGAGLSAKVQHPVEALSEASPLPYRQAHTASPTVYHDPCHLARSLGRVKEPRAMLEAATGLAPREPFHSGSQAPCCGGGGGMPAIVPDVAAQVARAAVKNLDAGPGETVVTACSSCRRRLERAGIEAPVRDLMEVLADAL